ncbi:MAG: DUF3137 domain-containing protein [Acholeplasmataceae bacterium]|nr:DUF3137 domain-containing protein [Acholeplasmataceae bacterium]
MEEKLKKYEQERLLMYDKYKKYRLIGFLTLIILIGIIFLILASNIKSKYDNFVKANVIDGLIKEMYEEANYQPNNMININYINSLGIYQKPDRWSGEDYFSGKYKGISFACSEVKLQERRERRDSKGNVQVYYVDYFNGRFYSFVFETEFKERLQIMEKRANGKVSGRLTKFETESIEFNKKFKTYATDQHYVFYQLTPVIQLNLLQFESIHRGTIQALYDKNRLDIAVNDSQNTLHLDIKTPLIKENLTKVIHDIQMPAAIINEFNLDSDKFKNL